MLKRCCLWRYTFSAKDELNMRHIACRKYTYLANGVMVSGNRLRDSLAFPRLDDSKALSVDWRHGLGSFGLLMHRSFSCLTLLVGSK